MDNLDDLKAIWRKQSTEPADTATPEAVQREVEEQASKQAQSTTQRWRASTVAALLVAELVNTASLVPPTERPWSRGETLCLALQLSTYAIPALYAVRRIRANKRLGSVGANLRDDLETAQAVVNDEMRDLRILGSMGVLTQVLLLLASFLAGGAQWADATGAAIRVCACTAAWVIFGFVGWWHYRHVLATNRQTLDGLLAEFEEN